MADNNGNIIAPLTVKPVNKHDNGLFPESLEKLIDIADLLRLDINNSYMTLDSGFDTKDNKFNILRNNLIPVIKPNPRNCKQEKRYELLDEFEQVEDIYKKRIIIERDFAWKCKYRKLVIRYEKLQCVFMGFRYLAYSLINFRELFGET